MADSPQSRFAESDRARCTPLKERCAEAPASAFAHPAGYTLSFQPADSFCSTPSLPRSGKDSRAHSLKAPSTILDTAPEKAPLDSRENPSPEDDRDIGTTFKEVELSSHKASSTKDAYNLDTTPQYNGITACEPGFPSRDIFAGVQSKQRSIESTSTALPLTEANLALHNGRLKSDDMAVPVDIKFEAYGIILPYGRELPAQLKTHIEQVIRKSRTAVTPNSAKLAGQYYQLQELNEAASARILEDCLLFQGETSDNGIPKIVREPDLNLAKKYLPKIHEGFFEKEVGTLEQPRPDSTLGYILSPRARPGDWATAFDSREEARFMGTAINRDLSFPWLTAQWKSQKHGQSQYQAKHQAARDGAAIVTYLVGFYKDAGEETLDVVKTCHFSLSCDKETVKLWVHWLEVERHQNKDVKMYYMECIEMAHVPLANDVWKIRRDLHNLLDYALAERLTAIKNAIPKLSIGGGFRSNADGLVSTVSDTSIERGSSTSKQTAPSSMSSFSHEGPESPSKKRRIAGERT